MPGSTRWSSASDSFPPDAAAIAWRPSRWAIAALLLLSALAPFSVLASGMPRVAAWPLAAMSCAWGILCLRRERGRAPRLLELRVDATVALDGIPLAELTVSRRGPLAFVRWRDREGRRGRLAWWPDTLPADSRRALALRAERPGK
jgi:toxin CptA